MNDRSKLRELRKNAPEHTKGRWRVNGNQIHAKCDVATTEFLGAEPKDERKAARLIAAEHNALPSLLDELDTKDAEIARLSARCAALEAAIRSPELADSVAIIPPTCFFCKSVGDEDDWCAKKCGTTLRYFEFDEARFAGKEGD